MRTASIVARAVLVAAFLLAAALKARDPKGTATAATGLGVSPALAGPVARGLPIAEAGTALLLAFWPLAGVVAAATLLCIFSALMIIQLRQGRAPQCQCFGALSTRPIGPNDVVRNAALLLLCGVTALAAAA